MATKQNKVNKSSYSELVKEKMKDFTKKNYGFLESAKIKENDSTFDFCGKCGHATHHSSVDCTHWQ